MATYAAYRHVELDKVGCGKRSIMKPPGGDSHDIFGADFIGTPSHHRVLKPPGGGTSSLFATNSDENQKPRVPQTELPVSQNSNTTLINGDLVANGKSGTESLTSLPVEHNNSDLDTLSIPSSVISAEIRNLSAQIQKRQHNGNPLTGDGGQNQKPENFSTRVHRQRDGNPLTGEGCHTSEHYVIRVHRQRDGNPVTGEGYDTQDNGRNTAPQPPRTRVPPGGYSSGLW